jgi:hypothetical protein
MPVLVFADEAGTLPVSLNAARVHAHLIDHPWLLQRLFPHRLPAGVRDGLRVLVVGFPFAPIELAALRALALPDLTVLEVHEWSVAGERTSVARPALTRPRRDDSGFDAPSGIAAADVADTARELLSWLARLDADVVVDGDRFARHVRVRGRPLCSLVLEAGRLSGLLADGTRSVLQNRADAVAMMDAVMQRFAQSLGVAPPGEAPVPELPDFGHLRQAVRDGRLTRAEVQALQERAESTA